MNKMTRTDYLLFLLIALVMVFMALSTPAQAGEYNGPDKPYHFVGSAVLSGAIVAKGHTKTEAVAITMVFGVAKEISDKQQGGRVSEGDLAYDLGGAVLGAFIGDSLTWRW